MRFLLELSLAVLLATSAEAAGTPLAVVQALTAPSPYRVVFVTLNDFHGAPAKFQYQVVDSRSGRSVATIPASYAPDEGSGDYGLRNAQGAQVYWSPDSQNVAIDETNHQFTGTVFIVELAHLQVHELTSKELTGFFTQPIERYRFTVGPGGWLDGRRLSIMVAGRLESATSQISTFERRGFATLSYGKVRIRLTSPQSTGN